MEVAHHLLHNLPKEGCTSCKEGIGCPQHRLPVAGQIDHGFRLVAIDAHGRIKCIVAGQKHSVRHNRLILVQAQGAVVTGQTDLRLSQAMIMIDPSRSCVLQAATRMPAS